MKKTNILIIVCDQMVADAVSAFRSYYEHPAWACHWVRTPNLDRLASRGVSFMLSHSTNPVCGPARASLFTGRHAIETGVTFNNIGIDQNVPNMGQWFEEHSDYDRVYCGKWHAGGAWSYPTVSGNRKIPGFDTLPVGNGYGGDFSDYQVSGAGDAWIRGHSSDRPFLFVAGLMNPHDICFWNEFPEAHDASRELYAGLTLPPLPPNREFCFEEPPWLAGIQARKTDWQWQCYLYDYYRMIEKMDADVGRLCRAVESRDDETTIIFTSDHGEGAARHSRVQKWYPYDESVRVPMIVSAPGCRTRGVLDREHLVSGVDVMRTVCDYAGLPPVPLARGLSLRPLIEGRPGPWRDHVYAEFLVTGRLIRTGRWKYVKFYSPAGDPDRSNRGWPLASGDWRDAPFLRADGTATQFAPGRGGEYRVESVRLLFDMLADPWETRNLADDPACAPVVAAHEAILRDEYEAVLVPGRRFDRNP